jgi:hypothetical protein
MMQKMLYAIGLSFFSVSLFAQKIDNPQTKTPNPKDTSTIKRVVSIRPNLGYVTEEQQQNSSLKNKSMTVEVFKKLKSDKLISVEDETGKFKKDTIKLPY